ncbi:hypothetical protein M3182_03130 [Mesobacillus maritimus]|uniref:hypothetical protein n=1 Tax=Mesobacillus maritimus TaxID=1643336 RepID=UPI00203E2DC6|nr:hypothetical protein [Mesobacillus maritimus]MCM3584738.1 hypothetical protein [Mesobacillus maritimus]MCM3671347.1 hypothetical protein [Mesobacillus maritimus]
MALIFLLSLMIGLYFVTLGIWELRAGTNRKKYLIFTSVGLFLLVVFPRLFTSF